MFPLFFPYRYCCDCHSCSCFHYFFLIDEQEMIDKKHAVQNIALTETMTLSLFSLIISYLLALSSSHFGHTSWPFADNSVEEIKSLPLIKVKCTTSSCHASCLGYFLASSKMLHCVTRRLACHPSYELLSPSAPNKEAVKCLTSYSPYKNVMTSSEIPKVCSNKKFKYSGSAISLSLLCARILFGRIRYLSSQPTHAVDRFLRGINFEKPKSAPHSKRGAWNGARFHWIESEWHTWGQWNLMQAENPICALKGLGMASHIWGQWNTLPSF